MSIHGRSGGQLEESAARGGCNRSTRPRERIYRGHRVYDASRHKEDNRRLIGSLRLKRTCAFDRKETLSDRFSSRVAGTLLAAIQLAISRLEKRSWETAGKYRSARSSSPIRRRKSTFEPRSRPEALLSSSTYLRAPVPYNIPIKNSRGR